MRLIALLAALVAALAFGVTPAFAFHHVFLPGGACGESEHSGGFNPNAVDALRAAGLIPPPLPPVGTPAAEHSDHISNTPGVECPAPGK